MLCKMDCKAFEGKKLRENGSLFLLCSFCFGQLKKKFIPCSHLSSEILSHVGLAWVYSVELITEKAFWEVTTRIHNMFTSSMNRLASVSSMTALFIHSTFLVENSMYLDA